MFTHVVYIELRNNLISRDDVLERISTTITKTANERHINDEDELVRYHGYHSTTVYNNSLRTRPSYGMGICY